MIISGNKGLTDNKISDPKNILNINKQDVQITIDKIRILEPLITSDLSKLSDELKTSFSGLEYSTKTASSIYDKLERESKNIKAMGMIFDPLEAISKMKDIIRYTEICEHDSIIEKSKNTINFLENKGYVLSGCKNYYATPFEKTGYMGIHLNFITPYGQEIELQVHSPESFEAKQEGHELYEKIRSVSTLEKDKEKMMKEIKEIHERISKPKDYETLHDFKLRNRKNIIDEKKKDVSISLERESNNGLESMVYSLSLNGQKILSGFENTQSDGSVFVYRNTKEEHYVASFTKSGELTGLHDAADIEPTIESVVLMAENIENSHKEWMKEHLPSGEIGEINMDELENENYKVDIDEMLDIISQNSEDVDFDTNNIDNEISL